MLVDRDHSGIPGRAELDETLPILHPDVQLLAEPPPAGVRATWIGHATVRARHSPATMHMLTTPALACMQVLVQMPGLTFITDPIFGCVPQQTRKKNEKRKKRKMKKKKGEKEKGKKEKRTKVLKKLKKEKRENK
jgi:hypothetical protein